MNRWVALKVQIAQDISNSLTGTFENQRYLDPAECDLGVMLAKKVKQLFHRF